MGDGLKRALAAAKATRQPRVKESGVLRACLDLLAAERIFHRRWNSGAVRDHTGRPVRFGQKGDADILAIEYWGMRNEYEVLWVECKSSDGRQTPEQKAFQQEVEEQGHTYLLVHSSDELLEWLKRGKAQ